MVTAHFSHLIEEFCSLFLDDLLKNLVDLADDLLLFFPPRVPLQVKNIRIADNISQSVPVSLLSLALLAVF